MDTLISFIPMTISRNMYSIHQISEVQCLNPNYDPTLLFLPSFLPIGTHYQDYPWRRERI